jgi:hypothetical protein
MVSHLNLERGLQVGLGEPGQWTTQPVQNHPLGPGSIHQILGQLLLRTVDSRHVIERLVHQYSSPPTGAGVSDQLHRFPDRPVPGHRRQRAPFNRPPQVNLPGARRACPPEDVGHTWGYSDFLVAVVDPAHEWHAELIEWIGGRFYPAHFDAAEVEGIFATLAERRDRAVSLWTTAD